MKIIILISTLLFTFWFSQVGYALTPSLKLPSASISVISTQSDSDKEKAAQAKAKAAAQAKAKAAAQAKAKAAAQAKAKAAAQAKAKAAAITKKNAEARAKRQAESAAIAKRKEKEKERIENERIAAERIRQTESDKIAKQKELDKQKAEEEYQARIAQEESLSEIDKDDKDDSGENISEDNLVSYIPQDTNKRLGNLLNADDSSIGSTPKDVPEDGGRLQEINTNVGWSGGSGTPNFEGSTGNSPDQGPLNPGKVNPNSPIVNPNRETGGATNTNSENTDEKTDKRQELDPLIQFINENSFQGYVLSEIPNWRQRSNSDNEPVINPISPDPVPGATGSSNGTPNSLRDFTNFGNKNGINPLIEGFAPEIQRPSTTPGNEESPLKTSQLDQLTNDTIVYEAKTKVDFETINILGDAEKQRKREEEEEKRKAEEEKRKAEEEMLKAAEAEGARLAALEARIAQEELARAIGSGDQGNGSGDQGNGSTDSGNGSGDQGNGFSGSRGQPRQRFFGNGSTDSGNGSTDSGNGSDNSNNSRENMMNRLIKADPSQRKAIYTWEKDLLALEVVDLEGQWTDLSGAGIYNRIYNDIQNLAKRAELPKDDKNYINTEEFGLRTDAELEEHKNIEQLGDNGRAMYIALREVEFIYGKGRIERVNAEIQKRKEIAFVRGAPTSVLTIEFLNEVARSVHNNTTQEQSKNERSNSPSVIGDWSQGTYEERHIANRYKKNKTNKKSSSDDDKSDNDSDD